MTAIFSEREMGAVKNLIGSFPVIKFRPLCVLAQKHDVPMQRIAPMNVTDTVSNNYAV